MLDKMPFVTTYVQIGMGAAMYCWIVLGARRCLQTHSVNSNFNPSSRATDRTADAAAPDTH